MRRRQLTCRQTCSTGAGSQQQLLPQWLALFWGQLLRIACCLFMATRPGLLQVLCAAIEAPPACFCPAASSPCSACSLQEWAQQLEALVLREGLSPRLEAGAWVRWECQGLHCGAATGQAIKRRACMSLMGTDLVLPGTAAGATRAEAKAAATTAHWGENPKAGGLYWATHRVCAAGRLQLTDWRAGCCCCSPSCVPTGLLACHAHLLAVPSAGDCEAWGDYTGGVRGEVSFNGDLGEPAGRG